jgi:hypothetical protein
MRVQLIALFAATGLISGCTCSEKPKQPVADATLAIVDAGKPVEVPPVPREVVFDADSAVGVRRFKAPRGETILSLSTSRDGGLLAAVSASTLYLFDASLSKGRAIDLPGVMPRAWPSPSPTSGWPSSARHRPSPRRRACTSSTP